MLTADRLTFAYPNANRPYAFSFEARPGEVTAISGASGSGKSTLLDLVAGFLSPTGGTLRLDGLDLVPLPPERRPVSILFQSESLFEHLSAERNVELGLPTSLAATTRHGLVTAALEQVGVAAAGPRRAETLSGGEKQRVALARTLVRDRPILLLDEPFSALDDATRTAIRSLVGQLTRERKWVTLLVTHHQDDIEAMASRHYRLADGELTLVAA
jgi:thiamine transport system ATP-binding protein